MKCITKRVDLAIKRGNIYCNTFCEYHPCHYKGQNCSFCYCPFYPCNDTDLGRMIPSKYGDVWDCSQCLFNHSNKVVQFSFREFKRLGIASALDPRIRDVFTEAKRSIFKLGKCVMILGTTSSVDDVAVAICRLLLRSGCVVTPFKLQSVCDSPRVTNAGHEISVSQNLQCKAAGLTNPSAEICPIFLKATNNAIWQVAVNGKDAVKCYVNDYYKNFTTEPGVEVFRKHIDFLKKRYDYVVMAGSDFPPGVDAHTVNKISIEMAKMADARCVFVADIKQENFLDDICLISEKDRQRVSGIVLRTSHRCLNDVRSEVKHIEELTRIPVIGIAPHIDVFSRERLRNFTGIDTLNICRKKISIIKFPWMNYLSDIDPLYLEKVAIEYATKPQNLVGTDAIVIPDTRNILEDFRWLKSTGLFDAIKRIVGKIPIVGICGGYWMMAKNCFYIGRGGNHLKFEGLCLFDIDSNQDENDIHIAKNSAIFDLGDGGRVEGYNVSTVSIENCKYPPLFMVKALNRNVSEGVVDETRKLYGTNLHGIFERPAFRHYIISKIYIDDSKGVSVDYNDYEEANVDALTDEFFETVNEEKFWGIFREADL